MREKRVDRRGVGAETGACGVREVGAASHGDSIREPNGGPMLPEPKKDSREKCSRPWYGILPNGKEAIVLVSRPILISDRN